MQNISSLTYLHEISLQWRQLINWKLKESTIELFVGILPCQSQIVAHSKWYHFPLATIQIWSQVARLWKSCLAIHFHPPSERIIQVAKRDLTAANRIKYDYFVTSEIRKLNLKQFRLKTEISIPVPSGLRRGFADDRFLGLPVRIRPRTWISLVSVVWCPVGVSRRRADPWSTEVLPMI